MQKNIVKIEHPRSAHMVGDGFRVIQYIPGHGREMSNDTSPFLMLDYNAPWTVAPQKSGYRPGVGFHPHRGFETVTIVYSGEIEHQDTAGNGGVIGADEVQWMTAGSGLLHNEFMTGEFSRMGGVQHMIQLWVNLPREHKMTTPRYQALTRENIPEVEFDGGRVRVIAGELQMKVSVIPGLSRDPGNNNESFFAGSPHTRGGQELQTTDNDAIIKQKGIAKTFSPVELYDVRFEFSDSPPNRGSEMGYTENTPPNLLLRHNSSPKSDELETYKGRKETKTLDLQIPENYATMILVTEGDIIVNGKKLENGDIAHFARSGSDISISSDSIAKALIMAGEPLGEPIVQYGPFVMNTQSEIIQAFADLNAGKMGKID